MLNYIFYLIVNGSHLMMVHLQHFLYFVFTCLHIKSATSNLFNDSINNSFPIFQKLNHVLSHCFPNNSNFLIITQPAFLPWSFLDPVKSIVVINEKFHSRRIYQHYPELATFIIVVNSAYDLHRIAFILEESIWWNYDSKCIIIKSTYSCSDASSMLNVAWDHKLLSTMYLCVDNVTNNITFYTYNPFTKRAPDPWVIEQNNNSKSDDDLLTFFKRSYDADDKKCINMIYDKLKYMDGYETKAIAIPHPDTIWDPKTLYNMSSLEKKVNDAEYNWLDAMIRTWNISLSIRFGVTYFVAEEDHYEFLLTPLFRITWDRDITVPTYPYQTTSIVILTQKRPFLTPEDKIISFYSKDIIWSILTACVTTIITLIINKRQRLSTAALEIMRLIVYCGIRQPLLNLPVRIYFFGIFWLVVIINATFQGNLATFLTKPERIYIETLEHLKNYKYNVYVNPQVHFNFEASFTSMETDQTPDLNAYQFVVNNSNTAFIMPDSRVYEPAFRYQLHVSKPILSDYVSMATCKDNFPFPKRIDDIACRCFEAGLFGFWEDQQLYKFKSNLSNTEELETQPRFRSITLFDLAFCFKLFAIGISCSVPVFIIEMSFNKIIKTFFWKQKQTKVSFFAGK